MRRGSTDSDRGAVGEREADVTAAPSDADRAVDARDDEQSLACPTGGAAPAPTTSEFVWCDQAQSPTEIEFATESGFEWCNPEDDRKQRSRSEPAATDGAVDTTAAADGGPTGLVLDPEIVTTARLRGIDDEATALLSTLRRHGEPRRTERTEDG
ncbi:hypothetical protein [Salinigranum marinum]|uniref:hypothetical protein n=1 Tax=Salinigranum marinum TaxID=1515595 RepID=UPI002989B7D9|nr:hypothetical protein [Salinigranum marinum]